MDIEIAHEIEKNSSGKIKFRKFKKGGYDHYNVRLFLKGSDLSKVSHVVYELHPTFANRTRMIDTHNNDFSLYIWTWGEFDVAITVYFKNGDKKNIVHSLSFSDMLPADDSKYVNVSPSQFKENDHVLNS